MLNITESIQAIVRDEIDRCSSLLSIEFQGINTSSGIISTPSITYRAYVSALLQPSGDEIALIIDSDDRLAEVNITVEVIEGDGKIVAEGPGFIFSKNDDRFDKRLVEEWKDKLVSFSDTYISYVRECVSGNKGV